ncbi:hypothetical protein NMT59_25365, partial [Escherichia coli]|nr:hypothetical protein [Escherichia coli]
FRIGIGSLSNYIKVDVEDCNVSSNNIGIANVVDSKLTLSTINANVMYGIKLSDGANDNIFSALKIEWNGENNLYVKNAVNNVISASILDRSGKAGIYLENSEIILNEIIIRRSGGSSNIPKESTHIYIKGGNAIINNIITKSGRNDDGKGKLSPDFSIYAENDASLIISDSDLTGRRVDSVYE